MYCLGCRYTLFGCITHLCPECGRAFHPGDPRTFSRTERQHWRWGTGVAALAFVGAGLAIPLASPLNRYWIYEGERICVLIVLLGLSIGFGISGARRGGIPNRIAAGFIAAVTGFYTLCFLARLVGMVVNSWMVG